MMLWTWIQEFQTLTVGFFGFVGVIFTLWFNAWQARKQRWEERRHTRQALRVALIEELKINRESLVINMDRIKAGVEILSEMGGYSVPTDLMDDGYRAFTDRIGLLSQAEVRKVMFAYLSLRTYSANLFLVGGPPNTGNRHVQVPVKKSPRLLQMQESLIGPIDEAIEVMERTRNGV